MRVGALPTTTRAVALFVCGSVATFAYLLLPPALQSRAYAAFAFGAAAAAAIRASGRGPHRRAWVLFACSFAAFAVADSLYDFALTTFPGSADIAYLTGFVFAVAAALAWGADAREQVLERALDAAVVGTSAALLVWVVWIHPVSHAAATSFPADLLALAYPTLDLVLITILVGGGRLRGPRLWLVVGLCLFVVADTYYARAALLDTYRVGTAIDVLWLLAYSAWVAASFSHDPKAVTHPREPGRLLRWVLAGALLTSPAALMYHITFYGTLHVPEVVLGGFLIGPLVVLRIAVAQKLAMRAMEERNASLEALRRTNELFSVSFAQSRFGMGICDLDGRLLLVNDSGARMLGYTPSELTGWGWTSLIHLEDVEEILERVDKLHSTSEPLPLEIRYKHKDGSDVWTETVVSLVPDAQGNPMWLFTQSRNITEEREERRAAERIQRQRQLLLESTGDGIIGVDVRGYATFANPAAASILGLTVEELLGTDMHELVHHSYPDGTPYPSEACPIRHAVREGRGANVDDEVFWRPDGSSFDVHYAVQPVFEEREVVGGVVSFRDVTQYRRLEEQLRHAHKMEALGSLAGGVAHDFNNLLFVIRSSADFLAQTLDDSTSAHEDIESIIAASDRASALVQKLLTFSRREVLQPILLNIGRVVADEEVFLRKSLPAGVVLRVEAGEDVWDTQLDPVHAEQILLNLIVNARDALPQGGNIVVSTSNIEIDGHLTTLVEELPPGRYACLQVSDDGVGMPPEVVDRIFEPFFSTKRGSGGTGLGLSTVYGIVKDAGGAIAVNSAEGVGTTFRVYLPCSDSGTFPEDIEASSPATGIEGRRVLVVDDDDAVRRLVERMLAEGGYTTHAAASLSEALEVHARQPDLDAVITDVVMPGGSGLELADQLHRLNPDLPVLLMSAYSDQLRTHGNASRDGRSVLQKPFSADTLITTLEGLFVGTYQGQPSVRQGPKGSLREEVSHAT